MLIPPYGDRLVDLMVPSEASEELAAHAKGLPSIQISERSVCDLRLMACGAFSPLDRFVGKHDHKRILDEMRLSSGALFPIPVTLPVNAGPQLHLDTDVALRNAKNDLLAVMTIEEIYDWDQVEVAQKVFGTEDLKHPLVAEMQRWGKMNIAGRLQVLPLPRFYDFQDLRLTPVEVRARLEAFGRGNVVAFQTRNPLHRAHEELTRQAIDQVDGTLLLHPVVGMTKPGDIDHYTRVRTYKILAERYYERDRILLALLPLAMRFAGPREALWHALIRRNYGANFLIVGRDHASPGKDSHDQPFYGAYEAQELVAQHSAELGVRVIPFKELSYSPEGGYQETAAVANASGVTISGSQVREEYLEKGRELPEWFTRPEIAKLLAEAYPPRHEQGFCIWLTGLGSAGKSTTAEILTQLLLEHGRRVTLLDGDVVRTHLSKGLGFSKEDRDTNIRRIGFVAAEIVRHGGAVVCAAVSPYQATRNDVRNMVGARFIEVFVDTPLEVCEQRDTKGVYARARRGEIKHVTGIDDAYEEPLQPEIIIETVTSQAEENARLILRHLFENRLLLTAGFES